MSIEQIWEIMSGKKNIVGISKKLRRRVKDDILRMMRGSEVRGWHGIS